MTRSALYSIDRAAVVAVFESWAEETGGQVADFAAKCGPNLLASHFWMTLQEIMEVRTAEQAKLDAATDAFVEDCRSFQESNGSGPLKDITGHRAYREIPADERAGILAAMAAYQTPVTSEGSDEVDVRLGEPRRKIGRRDTKPTGLASVLDEEDDLS